MWQFTSFIFLGPLKLLASVNGPFFIFKMKLLSTALASALLTSWASALGPEPPPKVDPTATEGFTWEDPFSSKKLDQFDITCAVEGKFSASEYQLHDLFKGEPVGLWPYADALKTFFQGREYPGGWDGIDNHGYERTLLQMTYSHIPVKVREWIEEQERTDGAGKGLYAVYEKPPQGEAATGPAKVPKKNTTDDLRLLDKKKIAIFAPGAIYETLPLWVAENSDCKGNVALSEFTAKNKEKCGSHMIIATLLDLTKYNSKPQDGGVIAWPTSHTNLDRMLDKRDINFTIEAQVLRLKENIGKDTRASEDPKQESAAKDEL